MRPLKFSYYIFLLLQLVFFSVYMYQFNINYIFLAHITHYYYYKPYNT